MRTLYYFIMSIVDYIRNERTRYKRVQYVRTDGRRATYLVKR